MRAPCITGARGVVLACACACGCGVIDQARTRVEALWGDEPEPVVAAVDPPVVGSSGPAPAGATSSAEPVAESSGGEAGASEASGAGSSATTGALPMSYAPAPTSGTADDGGATGGATGDEPTGSASDAPSDAPSDDGTTGSATPTPSEGTTTGTLEPAGGDEGIPRGPEGASCVEGEWLADDLHTYFRRDIERQAHGRPVKHRGESGRFVLRFASGVLYGEAKHRRAVFTTQLASVDIRYTVDLSGAFEASARIESTDTLVVDAPRTTTLRAREVVRFSAKKSETRTLTMPTQGRFELVCTPASLELRPLEDGKPGPALRFVRAAP